jgi:hypothetical protein
MKYIPTSESLPEEGKIVMTKIDDANGLRNETTLKRQGNLWFFPDGSMYVYYRPTHWRDLTETERAKEKASFMQARDESATKYERLMASL